MIEYEFPDVGPRTMCLNARKVFYEEAPTRLFCLA